MPEPEEVTSENSAAVITTEAIPEPSEPIPTVELPSAAVTVAPEISTLSTASETAVEKESNASIIDRWFSTTFPSSVIAQTTEGWNFVSNAKEELKKLLA